MEQKSYLIDTSSKASWHHGSGGMRDLKQLRIWVSEDLNRVHLNGIGKKGTVLVGGIGLTVDEMDELAKTWLKHRKENRVVYEVQHDTYIDGWVNTWSTTDDEGHEIPWLFLTREAAEKEIEEFIEDANTSPEREEDNKYHRFEFRVRPIPIEEANPASLKAIGLETFEEGERVLVELNEFYEGVITEVKSGFLTIMDDYQCTEDVTLDEVRKICQSQL